MLDRRTLINVLSKEVDWLQGKINFWQSRICYLEARLKVEIKAYRKEQLEQRGRGKSTVAQGKDLDAKIKLFSKGDPPSGRK